MKTRGKKSKAIEEPVASPTMCFVEHAKAQPPEYRPLVVSTLSGLMLFGTRKGTRFLVHVPWKTRIATTAMSGRSPTGWRSSPRCSMMQ